MDAFKRLGRKDTTLLDVSEMIHTHDIAQDGRISFAEFKKIFNHEDKNEPLDLQHTLKDASQAQDRNQQNDAGGEAAVKQDPTQL